MRRGCIIEFKRKGVVSFILGGLLKLFEKEWDGWGWHLGIAWEQSYDGWYILEATGKGVEANFCFNGWLKEQTRSYQWLDKVPSRKSMDNFLRSHLNKKYDVAVYIFTMLQYLFRHFVHIKLPLVLNDRYSCWELVDEFCDDMGKPWAPKYGFPLITDFLKAVKKT